MSCPRSRSRSGCFAVSASSSGNERSWRPSASSASIRSSIATSRSSSSRSISARANVLVREVGERVAAPERKRGLERRERLGRLAVGVRPPALLEQPLEADDVDLLRLDLEDVAAGPCQQRLVRLERLAQPRDLDVEAVVGRPRRPVRPKRVDQPVARDDLVRVKQEERQQRARLRAAERDRAAVARASTGPRSRNSMVSFGLLQMTLAPSRETVESDLRACGEAARRASRAWLADSDSAVA